MSDLQDILSDRNRLLIMSTIAATRESITFSGLLQAVPLTKGNLSSHLKRLEESGLIEVRKEFVERKPQSSYCCTKEGRTALQLHLRGIEKLLRSALGK